MQLDFSNEEIITDDTQPENIKEMMNLLGAYRKDLEQCKVLIENLSNQKVDLEEYNKRANDKIMKLLDTLKSEQEKQKQLSINMETLTMELDSYKASKVQ